MNKPLRILVIPDIHGVNTWARQAYAAIAKGIHVIFLGDYVDSYNEGLNTEIAWNLRAIIEFKNKFPDKVTLLLGNHDLAYVFSKTYTSGFQPTMWDEYRQIFESNWHLFDLAWGHHHQYDVHGNAEKYTLITHAGLTETFWRNVADEIQHPDTMLHRLFQQLPGVWEQYPIHETLNYLKNSMELLWQVGRVRKGMNKTGSIVWADKSELLADHFLGIDQIVGHTNSETFEIHKVVGDSLYFTDIRNEDQVIGFLTELV